MREQVELRFIVGYEDALRYAPVKGAFIRGVVNNISSICGGCTVLKGTGYWKDDGETHKPVFFGDIHEEESVTFVVTCEPHKVETVYSAVSNSIAAWVSWYGIDAEWVHVQQTSIIGRHFAVSKQPSVQHSGAAIYRKIVSPGTEGAR